MSQPATTEASTMSSALETPTPVQETCLEVDTIVEDDKVSTPIIVSSSTTTIKNAESTPSVQTATLSTDKCATKENVIFVVNKVDPGGGGTVTVTSPNTATSEVKLVPKSALAMIGSPSAGGATILKKGNTILKVQKAAVSQQSSPVVGKRNIVIASRPGTNQIIACTPVGQQPHGSTPVILTQKVVSGGVTTSPVVSTGVNAPITNVAGAKILSSSSGNSQQRLQDVRVDNWGNYCLQRLQAMYDKGDYCDLTLRFHSSQEIRVHRVVVNLCTEYFSNLEKLYGLNEGTLILPKDVDFQTMQTIIRFFYTGKLEVRGTQFNDIYRTVKMMNITILVKLLEAHSRKPTAAAQVKKEPGRSVVLKQAVDLGKGQKGQVQIQVATGQSQPASPVIAVPVAGSKTLQVAAPGMKLPPGVKTKTVLARVQSQTGKVLSPGQKVTPKKLPIWKDRKFAPSPKPDPPPLEKWQIKEEEPARPTRFEWGDPDEVDPFLAPPPMMNHALMEKQKEKHCTRKAEDIFDSVKSQAHSQSGPKRPYSDEASDVSGSPGAAPPMAKIPKLEAMATSDESVLETIVPDNAEEGEKEPSLEPVDINLCEDTVVEEVTTTPATPLSAAPVTVEKKPVPILKPALKSPAKTLKGSGVDAKGKDGTPQKTVRFALEVEKENAEKPAPVTLPSSPAISVAVTPSPSTSSTTAAAINIKPSRIEVPATSSDGGDPLVNHSKIISEVLRKFPDLVKDNKNIKLKIVQKPSDSLPGSSKDGKPNSKVSYIVLKSTSSSDATGSTLLKKSPSQSSTNKFWESDKTPKKPNPAENTTGPWLCERCGEGENTALQFDTYYNFRRHLVDVHGERIDARICEYCGQKASKRNLLLYHLYTKHGVQPPKNCTFPHCDRCDYVALSESLLNKHKQNHDANKEYSCSICNASFKSSSALQSHMTANLHRNKDTKVYECPYCRKPFVRNINLKAHIRALHRDVARLEEMEDPRLPVDDTLSNRIFANVGGKRRQFPSILTSARNSSITEMVEFVATENLGGEVSYVTADGQPIEILDPSTLQSLPLTLVSSGEDGMAAVATSVGTSLNVDTQQATETTEYVTGVSQDQQAVFVMDGSQQAVEIDMANMGLTLASDGTMVYEGDDQSQNYIVQDMQGNQFRRITGIDETGKPVVFLQMIGESSQVGMSPAILDESMAVDASNTNSQLFVSSSGMQIPVSSDGSEGQVIFATAPTDGAILQMVSSDGGSHQMVMSDAVLAAHQHIEEQQQSHLQLVQHPQTTNEIQDAIGGQMGQPVQELHLVLDQQENRTDEQIEQVEEQTEGMEIVEVPQPGFGELQYSESYSQEEIQQMEHDGTQETEHEEVHEQEQESSVPQEVEETQQIEIDENTQHLQIEDQQSLKEGSESETIDIHNQDTQVIMGDNLQESIELVEGQTLTLIEEEDGTQTLKVDSGEANVEDIDNGDGITTN